MTVCSDDVIEHLTRLGYQDAVNEINKLLNKDKTINERWRKYNVRIEEFAKKFGAFSIASYSRQVELEFDEYGNTPHLVKLAENINGDYYEYEEDACNFDEKSNTIAVDKWWFANIMHLWINKYSDYDFDIYQSKLVME